MMWSTGQNDVIRELGHKGVQAVHDEILDRYGVEHTLHAIEVQACRIHASLKVLDECPECHALGVRINRQSGMSGAAPRRRTLPRRKPSTSCWKPRPQDAMVDRSTRSSIVAGRSSGRRTRA